jgi:hypothetical protein
VNLRIVPALLLCLLAASCGSRNRADPELAAGVRKEVRDWIASLPKIEEAENGALPVVRGADAMADLPEAWTLDRFDPRDAKDAAALRDYLEKNAGAIRTVESGLAKEKFAYIDDFEKGPDLKVPALKPMCRAGLVLLFRGDLALHEGRASGAFPDYAGALRLGTSMSHRTIVVSWFVSMALARFGLAHVLRIRPDAAVSEADLGALLEVLRKEHDGRGSLREAADGEYYAWHLIPLARCAEKGDTPSNYAKDREIMGKIREILGKVDGGAYFALPESVRSGRDFDALGMGERSDAVVASTLISTPARLAIAAAEDETCWRGTLTWLAVRRFRAREGRFPRALEELDPLLPAPLRIDPFSGKPFVYAPEGNSFRLYSLGRNMSDDGGDGVRLADPAASNPASLKDIVFEKP